MSFFCASYSMYFSNGLFEWFVANTYLSHCHLTEPTLKRFLYRITDSVSDAQFRKSFIYIPNINEGCANSPSSFSLLFRSGSLCLVFQFVLNSTWTRALFSCYAYVFSVLVDIWSSELAYMCTKWMWTCDSQPWKIQGSDQVYGCTHVQYGVWIWQ